ncbi:MAG: ABC transporter permease [Thermomicrobiales bacterium]|nr:ABC transporter permease [Thermomicrobiales bacterium]MCO5220092.1 ABC transporter permease [Thermomicrobiales bacterium]
MLVAIPTLIGVSILIFIAMRVIPGDPLAMIGAQGQSTLVLSSEEKAAARKSLGLDKPLYRQYLNWMGDVGRGDFGHSFWSQEPIRKQILRRGPITAEIAILAVVISWLMGVPVGLLSALRRNTVFDHMARVGITLFMAIPSFWLGMIIVLVSVRAFVWRPPLAITQIWEQPAVNAQIVIGPAVALGVGLAAVIARMTRSTALDVLGEDYVRTARAKGLGGRKFFLPHVFRNTLLPVITTSGVAIGGLLGGTVATETAFGVPGLGSLLVQSINQRDWVMIQNLVLLYAAIFIAINLLVDISYALIDPRIRFG